MALRRSVWTALLVLAVAAPAAAVDGAQEPAVSGQEAYREECLLCHKQQLPPPVPRTCAEWKKTVARMSSHRERLRKSAIEQADQALIASYLADLRE